jgi:hypothetical protein
MDSIDSSGTSSTSNHLQQPQTENQRPTINQTPSDINNNLTEKSQGKSHGPMQASDEMTVPQRAAHGRSPVLDQVPSDWVELYENERYVPLSGWSAGSLMPTDRCAFSTKDGNSGWKTIYEAEQAMLSPGWEWGSDSAWVPKSTVASDIEGSFTDSEPVSVLTCVCIGWEYAVNFGNIDEGSCGSKGLAHFVRRRRLIRKRCFLGKRFAFTY